MTEGNLILVGLLFGLIMIAPLICSVITEACRPTMGEDE